MTGGSGLIGSYLIKEAFQGAEHCVVRADRSSEHPTDLTKEDQLKRFFEDHTRVIPRDGKNPVLLHLAAIVNGKSNLSEQQMHEMHSLNVLATQAIAYYSIKHGFPIVHISTDYVFRGYRACGLIQPDDQIIPDKTPYSQTKAKAEEIVLSAGDSTTVAIIRLGFPYGQSAHSKPEFLTKVINWIKNGQPLVTNQTTSPSPMSVIAEGCKRAIHLIGKGKLPNRTILHLSGEPISPYEFGSIAAQIYGLNQELSGIEMDDREPINLALDHTTTEELLNIAIPGHVREIENIHNAQCGENRN